MAIALAANLSSATLWIIIAGGLLLALILLLGLVVWRLRKWWLVSDQPSGEPWTLEDLRVMRARGDLSEAEYQAMREAMIDAYRGKSRDSDSSAGQPDAPDSGGLG